MGTVLKKQLKKLFRSLGLEVSRWPDQASLSGHLYNLFETIDPDLVLDIGANKGQFVSRLREEVRYGGSVLSFEPTPESFDHLLQRTQADSRWKAMNLAVGAESGTLNLQIYSESKWNSSRDVDFETVEATGRNINYLQTVSVQMVRLEDTWPTDARRTFLKSDTQGNEVAVLQGLGNCVPFVAGMLLEAPLKSFYKDEPSFHEIISTAMKLGFHPTGFFPVSRSRGTLELDTIDVVFTRAT